MTSALRFCLLPDNEPDVQAELNEEAGPDEAHAMDGGDGGPEEIEEIEEELEEVAAVAAVPAVQEPAAGSEGDQLTVLESLKAMLFDIIF
eukprot:symbB.v1.2.016355.t1/scaffold1222.1/size194531/29